jgi:ABC-type glutathione transport system ATPase component
MTIVVLLDGRCSTSGSTVTTRQAAKRGRVLAEENIVHYQRIVVALKETMQLMEEIDEVIDRHGGWLIE